ncbi:MAG: alpha-galactosidase [Bacteroidia bacterium]
MTIHYELYDGIPVIAKWIEVRNRGQELVTLNHFTSEILAAVEYGSMVETREYTVPTPNIHVETDYAFSSFNADDANHHVVHWEADPDYHTQVNYLKQTKCLLKVRPELGPNQIIEPGKSFTSFRTFILPYDSYDRERRGLAMRRMYRTLAPWTTENPLMMHARFADWERVKTAIDQAAEAGFEMVILTFGSGFNIEDDSPEYIAKMKEYAEYAKNKGVEIGGYSLLASRKIGGGNDVVMPEGQTPTFGNSPCIGSKWGEEYFGKLYQFYQKTGFTLLEHDGSYPGDVCTSTDHPGHQGYEDSRWNQYQVISQFYQWCRSQGIYLNIPDYYYMTGGNKCGMGYREVNWSLPRAQQVIHTRQNIYDGTWEKRVSMGWMFVPLTEYHGGGEAATIEPLNEHLDHYETMMMSNLGAGVQACYRGPRLYDSEETQHMVSNTVNWYKTHREILEGDFIHLRRADGRDIDYWLLVNPDAKEKGALVVFNPLNEDVSKNLEIPLYYTGLTDKTTVVDALGKRRKYRLGRDFKVKLSVTIPAGKWGVWFFE